MPDEDDAREAGLLDVLDHRRGEVAHRERLEVAGPPGAARQVDGERRGVEVLEERLPAPGAVGAAVDQDEVH